MKLNNHLSLLIALIISMMVMVPITAKMVDTAAVKSMVANLISQKKVVLFSKSYCPFCRAAKTILKQMGEEYLAFELDERGSSEHLFIA